MAEKVIFLGNGPLADYALEVIKQSCEVIFHARTKEDLAKVCEIKRENPEVHGILASFGVLIKSDVLELFEPEGILNIHPSLLPLYRGASPIESAILNGDTTFGVSVMKLVKAMDAGPIYKQATIENVPLSSDLKDYLYKTLAEMGAAMVLSLLKSKKWPTAVAQDDLRATYCGKLDKSMSYLTPNTDTAEMTMRKIAAFFGYPKAKYQFFGKNCIILEAHICEPDETALLSIPCADGVAVAVDLLQPEGKKPMNAKSFLNGYGK